MDKRKIYDVTAPNRSTKIIEGKSSNVLNWNDCRFSWAYPMYKTMLGNFWIPSEINMTQDKKQWERELSEDEKEAFKKIIGLLAFLDSIQTDYSGRVADYLTDSSLVALMQILSFQEVVHNESYSYVLQSLVPKKEQDEIFEYWKTDHILLERNGFIADGYEEFVTNPTPETLLRSIVYDVILEGLFFYAGFAFFYDLARRGKMKASSDMISFINRDEQHHVTIFCNIFKELLSDYPQLNTKETAQFVKDTFRKAAELEIKWGEYIIGNKFDGIDAVDLEEYIKFTANKRVKQLGYDKIYPEVARNPFRKWILAYENVDRGKQDFFEGRSRQYTKVDDDNGFDDL